MPPPSPQVVTRFAPSPTGHLHVGGARTALFCWAFARKHAGSFILRIEDTDAARSSDESARGIMEDLAWLGIDWDEGPELAYEGRHIGGNPRAIEGGFFQARRVPIYDAWIRRLVEQGKAYPAFEKPEELEAKRQAAIAAKQTYRYDRASFLAIPDVKERLRRMDSGEPHVVRFLAPRELVVVHDEVLGDVKYAPGEMDDFVIRKVDGFPTYHFAVVIDDEVMGVTHVLRAQEHLNNTPRHVALQKALGFRTPTYAHMPLIFNMDGSKMGKRDKAKAARKELQARLAPRGDAAIPEFAALLSAKGPRTPIDEGTLRGFLAGENDSLAVAAAVADAFSVPLPEIQVNEFRENGYAPEAMCNFLALLGWNPGMKTSDGKDLEKFDNAFIAQHFSIDRIGKTNSKFDRKKLLSFNGDRIASLPDDAFIARWRRWLEVDRFEDRRPHPDAIPPALARLLDAGGERLRWLIGAVKPRAKTFRDAEQACAFLAPRDAASPSNPEAVAKHLDASNSQGRSLLRAFADILQTLPVFDPPAIHAALEAFAKANALPNAGPIAQAIRVAVTGGTVSPGIAEMLAVLGREESLRRIGLAAK